MTNYVGDQVWHSKEHTSVPLVNKSPKDAIINSGHHSFLPSLSGFNTGCYSSASDVQHSLVQIDDLIHLSKVSFETQSSASSLNAPASNL